MGNSKSIYVTLGASNHVEEERAEDDFYSTAVSSVEAFKEMLEKYPEIKIPDLIIEPSVGNGNIARCFDRDHKIIAFDIVDRGYPNTNVVDWMEVKELPDEPKCIIANPPYELALEHLIHGMELLKNGEYNFQFLKIQFLEGIKRREFFNDNPPRYVWVFSSRQKCLKNNIDVGGSSAVCYAWYVFQKGYKGLPEIDWI